MAGNARNKKLIHEKTDEMLEQDLGYVEILKPFCEEEEESAEEKTRIPDDILRECLEDMKSAAEELDKSSSAAGSGKVIRQCSRIIGK